MQDATLTRLAARTDHFSGSDLYELCAAAASIPANELSKAEMECVHSSSSLKVVVTGTTE